MSDLISNGVATIGGLIKSLTELLLAVVSLSIVQKLLLHDLWNKRG